MSVELAGYLGLIVLSAAVTGSLKAPVVAPAPPAPAPAPVPPAPAPPPAAAPVAQLVAFCAATEGKFVNPDNDRYGFQCVELTNKWCLAIGIEEFWNDAWQFEFDPRPDCDWIANTPTNAPSPGDIVVWGRSATLPFGHVAVALSADAMTLHTFDQNWPLGSPCHRVTHTYAGVRGWLHPRKLPRTGRGGAWF